MPITQSAKKAIRNSGRKRQFNLDRKTTLTSLVKKLKKLVTEGKVDEAKKLFPEVQKAIDKAAKTHLIDKNTASRKKSRIAKLLKKNGEKK